MVGGYEQVSVEAVCIGIWKFKGNPAPLQMVHVTCGNLRGRTFAAEPPKGKVSYAGRMMITFFGGQAQHKAPCVSGYRRDKSPCIGVPMGYIAGTCPHVWSLEGE